MNGRAHVRRPGRRALAALALAFGAGLLARLALVAITASAPPNPATDEPSYGSLARNLVAGRGFVDSSENLDPLFPSPGPTSFWSPLYPLGVAATFRVFGTDTLLPVKLLQVAASLATAALVGVLAYRLFGPPAGLLGAVFYAVYPVAVYYTRAIGTETLYALVLLGFTLQAYRLLEYRRTRDAVLLGALYGLGVLTSGVMLAYGVPLLLFLALNRFSLRTNAGLLGVALLAFALVVSPWVARNYRLHGELVLLPAKGGFNLWVGNHPGATGAFTKLPAEWMSGLERLPELERDRVARARALTWIGAHPGEFLALGPRKIYGLWTPFPNVRRQLPVVVLQLLSYGTALLFCMATLFTHRRRLRPLALPYLLFATQTLVAFLFFGAGRWRFPLDPLVIAVASGSATVVLGGLLRRGNDPASLGGTAR